MSQEDVERVQEFRKCVECFLCQDVCHVLREHQLHDEFIGPRYFVHVAALEMHPLDEEDRLEELRTTQGVGYCNITKCCTKVCRKVLQLLITPSFRSRSELWTGFMILSAPCSGALVGGPLEAGFSANSSRGDEPWISN